MYIERVPNRNSPPCTLLRESYRHGGKVKKRTIANLSKWPKGLVEGLQVLLRGGAALDPEEGFEVVRTRPHGHVMAVLGTVRKIGLDRLLAAPLPVLILLWDGRDLPGEVSQTMIDLAHERGIEFGVGLWDQIERDKRYVKLVDDEGEMPEEIIDYVAKHIKTNI